jgi:hypothetical protein
LRKTSVLAALSDLLGALGLRMILVADPDAIEKYRERRVRRQENQVRRGHHGGPKKRP